LPQVADGSCSFPFLYLERRRLPTIGTILKNGDLAIVGSMNFQRWRRPGRVAGCRLTPSCSPEQNQRK
jgi:hypothetical protein